MTRPDAEYITARFHDPGKLPGRVVTDEMRAEILGSGKAAPVAVHDLWAAVYEAAEAAEGYFYKRPAPEMLQPAGERDRAAISAVKEIAGDMMAASYDRERGALSSWLESQGIEAGEVSPEG